VQISAARAGAADANKHATTKVGIAIGFIKSIEIGPYMAAYVYQLSLKMSIAHGVCHWGFRQLEQNLTVHYFEF
jgi:hypothetical protein